jgi:hypothetical protein
MDKFDEILMKFRDELYENYGKEPKFKLVLGHEMFNDVMIAMNTKANYATFMPSAMNDCRVCGIKIDARGREEL